MRYPDCPLSPERLDAMKVLVADKLHASVVKRLTALSDTCLYEPSLKAEDLPARAAEADVLIVRSTKVTSDTILAAKRLSLIIRAGAGVNTIDLAAASE